VKSLSLHNCKNVGLHTGTTLNELRNGLSYEHEYGKPPFIGAATEMSKWDELLSMPFQELTAS